MKHELRPGPARAPIANRALAIAGAAGLALVLIAPLAQSQLATPRTPMAPPAQRARPATNQTQITPNYKDADLGQIIEAVSQLTGKNFIVDPRVKAQVTMLSATPMSVDAFYQAFLALLEVHGYVAVPDGAVTKIVPDANARQMPATDLPDHVSGASEELVTQVVQLHNVSANQLVPVLRPLIPQAGHLAAYPAANILIISDHENNVHRMIRIIDRIDQASNEDIDVIRLEHASATELVRVMNTLYAAAGAEGTQVKMVADERTNSVLISGERNARLRLKTLVTHLDTPLAQGGGETQVRYLNYADAEKIATKLKEQVTGITQATAGAGGGAASAAAQAIAQGEAKGTTIWADPATNALVVTATPKIMRNLMGVVDRLDVRRAQVLLEAIIVDVETTKSMDFGVNWAAYNKNGAIPGVIWSQPIAGTAIGDIISGVLASTGNTPSQPIVGGGTTNPAVPTIPGGATAVVGRINSSGTNWASLIRALASDSNTNILSTPQITTLDNQEAQIKIAQEVPFVTGQYTSGTSVSAVSGVVNPFQTIQREEVGTIMKITPQITDDGTILLKIDQEVSSLATTAVKTVDVVTNKRTISTKVLVADGEVIVLGGLIEEDQLQSEDRIPLLGSIPWLGQLFKVRTSQKTKTNLMVFIRPTVLLDGQQVAAETGAKYNFLRALQQGITGGKADMLHGEHQPTLPDLDSLKPTAGAPTSRGYKSSQAPVDQSTGIAPGSLVPRGATPASPIGGPTSQPPGVPPAPAPDYSNPAPATPPPPDTAPPQASSATPGSAPTTEPPAGGRP
jgi:general secretion pathway protein D